MGRYKKLITIPVVIIIVCVYLIGLNLVNRIDRVGELKDAVPTEAETVDEREPEGGDEASSTEKLDINTASQSDLMTLEGIGETIAKRILERREQTGGFASIDELLEVEGVGEKKYNAIKDFITIGSSEELGE